MFTPFSDPGGNFAFVPMPAKLFSDPPVFGGGALLVLNQFATNATSISAKHSAGIKFAAAQVRANFGQDEGVLEVYGVTDRTGSEKVNNTISAARARNVLTTVKATLGLSEFHLTASAGLGERFADEYRQEKDGSKDANMRGVACYFWESIATARDPMLVLSIKFARPPKGDVLLAPLFLGRFQSSPPSPFA